MSLPSWPTGPIPDAAEPTDAPPETAPAGPEVIESCPDPECLRCRVARVGAATICGLVGVDFEALPRFQQVHYEHVATEVMASMSEALIEWGVVTVPGDQS